MKWLLLLVGVTVTKVSKAKNAYQCLGDQECIRETLVCDQEDTCSFICKGTAACAQSRFVCKDNYSCHLTCSGEFDGGGNPDILSCYNATVICPTNAECKITVSFQQAMERGTIICPQGCDCIIFSTHEYSS